jgi:hypothetical protein
MRVVISDLPPVFPDRPTVKDDGLDVTDEEGHLLKPDGTTTTDRTCAVTADIELGLDRLMELLKEARESEDGVAAIPADDEVINRLEEANGRDLTQSEIDAVVNAGGVVIFSVFDLEAYIKQLPDRDRPPKEQLRPNDGAGTLIGKLIYNTVTTFYVGEKIMIQMPTWFFPAGAGPYSEAAKFTTHGEPSPTATFRFAEPIFIDRQQNFRVEIEIPDADVLKDVQRIYGPLFIWVVLDGYMTRDVQ